MSTSLLIKQISISYSQLCVFDPALTEPYNEWLPEHNAQGFSWRPGSVSFATSFDREAMHSGRRVRAINQANGNPATRYVHPRTGQSVVVDNVTGEVIHVGGPGFGYGPQSGDVP